MRAPLSLQMRCCIDTSIDFKSSIEMIPRPIANPPNFSLIFSVRICRRLPCTQHQFAFVQELDLFANPFFHFSFLPVRFDYLISHANISRVLSVFISFCVCSGFASERAIDDIFTILCVPIPNSATNTLHFLSALFLRCAGKSGAGAQHIFT